MTNKFFRIFILVSMMVCLSVPTVVSNDNDKSVGATDHSFGGIEWSGFFDVTSNFQSSTDDETEFALGQAEIGLESELAKNIAVEVAIAYNNHESVFELGAAIIDINLYSGEESFLSSVDIATGQFDVPFGVDYHEYASIDNKLVTGPSVVHYTHDAWNDAGVQFNMDAVYGNFTFYIVNGFESSLEVIDDAQALSLGVDVGDEVDTSPANALGTRLGIAPVEWLEVGTSFANGWNADSKSEMRLIGADLQFELADFHLVSEYISHSVNRSIAEETNNGYYAQATYHILNEAYVTSRYGSFKAEGHEWHGQASIGGGYYITEDISLRVETVIDEVSDNNQTILQMVAGF